MTLSLRSLRAAAAACALILAGACTPGAPSSGPTPQASTGLDPREWTAESSAAEIAAWVNQGCRRAAGGRDVCIERTLTALLDQAGVARSMEVLDTLAVLDPGTRDNAHALAHGLGISAYRTPETVGATFAQCPTSQMSGCFHGVVQGYFLDLGRRGQPIGPAEMDGLCAPYESRQFIFFHCAHGMGHGLMALHQNHLPTALAWCDRVSRDFVRESCYGGAFMENAIQVTHPHHTAAGHAGTQGGAHGQHDPPAGEHAAHGGHAAAGDAHAGHGAQGMRHGEWRALDPDDMLYPCNAVDVKYQASCYGFQPSPIMFYKRGDVAATGRVCERAPAAFVSICFNSLGREVTAWADQEHPRTIGGCQRVGDAGGGQGRVWCLQGAVETLINQAANAEDGMRFCRAVPGADAKEACYRSVGTFTVTLLGAADVDGRTRQCAAAEPGFVAACRRGADLPPLAEQSGS